MFIIIEEEPTLTFGDRLNIYCKMFWFCWCMLLGLHGVLEMGRWVVLGVPFSEITYLVCIGSVSVLFGVLFAVIATTTDSRMRRDEHD